MVRLCFIIFIMLCCAKVSAQRSLVVINAETKLPIRDVLVRVDNGEEKRTAWDGRIAVPDSFSRADFCHPRLQRRYVLGSEQKNDTVYLLPQMNVIDEVVVIGHDRSKEHISNILRPTTPKEVPLPQVIPSGPNVLAMLGWIYDHTIGPKLEARHKRKKALKKIRAQEAEYERMWELMESPHHN